MFESIFHVGKQLRVDPGFFSNNQYMDYKPLLLVLSIMHKTGILHDTLNNVLVKLVCRTFIMIHDTYSRQNCILQSVELLSACGFLYCDSKPKIVFA